MVTCANSHWIACSRPAIPGFASAGSRYDGKHRLTSLFVAASKRASTTDQDESASTSGEVPMTLQEFLVHVGENWWLEFHL